MNANELADLIGLCGDGGYNQDAATMLRQQQAEIETLKAGKIRAYDNGVEDGKKSNTNPAKTLTDEIEYLKNELMMEEESYMLLNESFLFAKESIKQQQIKIKELETKTLTDTEIVRISETCDLNHVLGLIDFARAILRKAQEKC